MNETSTTGDQWNERSNALTRSPGETETMFRLLFERSADAIWLYDPKDRIFVDCNTAAVELMRCGTRDRLLLTRPADLSPPVQPDGRPSAEAALGITETVERLGALRFEWVARRFDGTDVPLEVIATAIQAQGRSVHVVVSRDISERKAAERALKQSEQLLSSIADNITEAVYRTDPEHRLAYVNGAYLRMFGYSSLEEVQRVPRERLYAQPEMRKRLLAALAQEGRFDEELEFVRQDGTRFWARMSSVAIRDQATGRTSFHVGTITDVTGRRASEEKIRQLNATLERRVEERTAELTRSEARLRTLIEHAPEAIVVFDGDSGRFLSCNENAIRLFGLAREELLTMHPAEVSPLFQPDGRLSIDAARDYIAAAMSGRPAVFEWVHRRADGRLIPCEIRLVRLPGEGRPLVRGSVIDNSERRRREKVQQATFDILEAVHQSGDLASLFARIHGIIQGLMPADNFYIAILDPATDLISFPYYVEGSEQQAVDPRPIGTGLTGYVLRTGRPLLVDAALNARKRKVGDAVTFEGYDEIAYVESGRPAAIWLGVPLYSEGRPSGVMAVQDYHDESAYGEEEKQILNYIARQTALAIDRKRSEQALRESEQKFRALFEASSQGVMLHDENRYLEVNPATLRILGYQNASDLVGKNPADTSPVLQPGGMPTAEMARLHIAECMEKGSTRFDWIASRADGREVPLEVILTRIEMGGRQIIQAVINDISERKKAEAELRASEARVRESEARFSAAFHASPVYITIARLKDGHFVEVNEAFVRWLGADRGEILGRTSAELGLWVNAEDRAGFWRELNEKGKVRDRECLFRNRRGTEHVSLLSGDIIEIDREPHVLTVGLDITDRKNAEAELLRALGREKELSQLKSNFVSMVSHEFRTPLGIIMSSAEILQDYLEQLDAEERGHHLRSIARNSRRMADMMEEVLVLGRLDAGRMDFKPAPLEIAPFFGRLVDELLAATENRCPISLRIGAMPPEGLADDRLLRHAFLNLLTNAVKYSEPGQPVVFDLERAGPDVVCRIIDHGIGIPEADLAWLFNAFHRGRNVGQRPGTGLGLVIVKRCVELHGGRIQIESEAGRGTVVTVRLPMFSSHRDSTPQPS